jgi:hypothetical protein
MIGCVQIMINGQVSTMTYTNPPQDSTVAVSTDTTFISTEEKFQRYIMDKMISLGFRLTTDANRADYIVVYSYKIGDGKGEAYSSPDYVVSGKTATSSATYPRYFHIVLVDRKASAQRKEPVFAFQGEVHGSSSSTNDTFVTKYLIDQIFANYSKSVEDVHFSAVFK